jgi:signal transduction histidine kinase
MIKFIYIKRFLLLAVLTGLFATTVFASNKQDAINLVNTASNFYKKNGLKATVAEINNPKGLFVKGNLYVFAYDLSGTNIAHPFNPKLIGKNFLDKTDASGKTYRREILNGAKSSGSGWVDYLYKDPKSGRTEKKSTYYKLEGDMILCAGIYLGAN